MTHLSETESLNYIQRVVEDDLGWIFRRQEYADHGIDGYIEIGGIGRHDVRKPFGQIIAVQVKGGESYARKGTPSAIRFDLTNPNWLLYWQGHSLPVIVVVYSPKTRQAYWRQVPFDVPQDSKSLMISRANVFDKRARAKLTLTALSGHRGIVDKGDAEFLSDLGQKLVVHGHSRAFQSSFEDLIARTEARHIVQKSSSSGLIEVDTSIEDYSELAWIEEPSYVCLHKALIVASGGGLGDYSRVFSISSRRFGPAALETVTRLCLEYSRHPINFGVLRRDDLPPHLNRGFFVVNNSMSVEFKMDHANAENWIAPLVNISPVSAKWYRELFGEIAGRTLWLSKLDKDLWHSAMLNYFGNSANFRSCKV